MKQFFNAPRETALFICILAVLTLPAILSAAPVFWLDLESKAAFTGYNNVQIPADTGTRLSLADDLDPDPVWYYRLRAGEPLEGSYVLVDGARFRFAAGISGKIRDAYIALKSPTEEAKRTDLGFVPLIHLDARWRLNRGLVLELSGDGLAAPQGRAEDFMAAVVWSPQPDLDLRLGYRLLEGALHFCHE